MHDTTARRDTTSIHEIGLRHEVAAATLMLNAEGIMNYSGHVSVRLPAGDRFLIQSFNESRAELRPEDLLVCGLDGQMVSGPDGERPVAEVFIHSEILRARPDVNAVAHFHHDLTTTFTLVEDVPLIPIKNHAVRWENGIPVHADPSHVATAALGKAVAETLGPHHAMLIRAHGQVVVAESVVGLFIDCVHFVENATALYHAAMLGKVKPLTPDEMRAFRQDFKRGRHLEKLWHYYVDRGRASGCLPVKWMPMLAPH
jgi:ribulose-5-phosphate 4-epimerase/fuculose-1-phosphate aldolase